MLKLELDENLSQVERAKIALSVLDAIRENAEINDIEKNPPQNLFDAEDACIICAPSFLDVKPHNIYPASKQLVHAQEHLKQGETRILISEGRIQVIL